MPILTTNRSPAFDVTRCSHAVLGVRDLAASKRFYVDLLGWRLTEQTSDALYLRGMECRGHHSLVLRKADQPSCQRLAIKLGGEEDLDAAASWFAARGLPVEFVDVHAQGRTFHTRDPFGMPLEFYHSMEQAECLLQRYVDYRGARIQRFDHFNCYSPDVQKSYEFYNAMGFRPTEYTESEEDGNAMWAIWLHRKGGSHDIAFTNGKGPRLHHFAAWVPTPLDLIHVCDILASADADHHIERGFGRHGIGNAFFLYLRDPDQHRIELFVGDYLTVDTDLVPKRWEFRDKRRQTLWGTPAPMSWFTEGTEFDRVPPRDPSIAPKPIVAH